MTPEIAGMAYQHNGNHLAQPCYVDYDSGGRSRCDIQTLLTRPGCADHIPESPERFRQLVARYGDNPIGIIAELAKKNEERKLMHQMLSEYGIVDKTPEGRELCLVARLAIALEDRATEEVDDNYRA